MSSVGGQHVEEAVAEMVAMLTPHADLDWQAPAGSLEWSCWTTAAHVAHDLAAYAGRSRDAPPRGTSPSTSSSRQKPRLGRFWRWCQRAVDC